jgi:Fur family ferric uptake transcriptional regulator
MPTGFHDADSGGLRSVGLKATSPRLKILQLLRGGPKRHWSADEVYRDLAGSGDDVGLATVYRVLAQLEQAGIVRRSSFDAGRAMYELDDGPHHDHLVCVRCGQVDEFVDEAIEARQQAVARERGFELTEHRLALFGLCAACRAQSRKAV